MPIVRGYFDLITSGLCCQCMVFTCSHVLGVAFISGKSAIMYCLGTFRGNFISARSSHLSCRAGNHAGPISFASEPLLRENDSMIVCQLA